VTENEIAKLVLDAAYKVHSHLGPGLLESVYEAALSVELMKMGLTVERQVPFRAHYDGVDLQMGFRADLIVAQRVLIEIKSVEVVPKVAYKVVLTYLRMTGMHLGILLNFGGEYLKDGIKRVVNYLPDEGRC
jgi:GxxExxY protein